MKAITELSAHSLIPHLLLHQYVLFANVKNYQKEEKSFCEKRTNLNRKRLHSIHEGSLDLIEHNDTEHQYKRSKACSVAKSRPAEFSHAKHAELERFHDAGERVRLHEHLEARIFDGAERVNYGGGVHPKLNDKAKQESEVAVLGGEAAEQHSEAEGERGNQNDEYRREQRIQIRMYRRVDEYHVVREHQEK